MSWIESNVTVLDGNGTAITMRVYSENGTEGFCWVHNLINAAGDLINPATADLQSATNTLLGTIATELSGAATEATQAAGNSILSSIASEIASPTPAGTNHIGAVSNDSNTSGGASIYSAFGSASGVAAITASTARQIKAGATNLYGMNLVNNLSSSDTYLSFYDALAADVAVGTTAPKFAVWIPAGGGWEEKFPDEVKISFAIGLTISASTSPNGTPAPGAALLANIIYK